MWQSPKISIIVPVYKAEKYLVKCIESIMKQTFSDYELLLIDDGSPDSSGEICDEWAVKDNRIRVFHQKNSGVSTTRNMGIDEAYGEYVTFIDPDDYVSPFYLFNLYNQSDKYIDFIIQGYNICNENGCVNYAINFATVRANSNNEIKKMLCRSDISDIFPVCSKLYKRSFLNDNKIRFKSDICSFEDALFLLNCISMCKNIYIGDKADYYYINHPGTLSKSLMTFEQEQQAFQLCYHCIIFIAGKYNVTNSDLKSLMSLVRYPFQRALKVDYHKLVPRRIRKKHLCYISKNTNEYLRLFYSPEYRIDKIGRLLLLHNCVCLYDSLFYFLFKLKIKKMFLPPGCYYNK